MVPAAMSAVFVFWGGSMSHVMNTYARLPVAFSHGQGCRITDSEGREYLDALSGIAVSTLGHAHPRLVAAIAAQAGRLLHTSNLYRIREQEELADRLAELSGMQEIFFCNSGCEANEAAIKLARYYGHRKGIDSPTIVVMEKAFHGRTMATLSATGNRKAQAGFEPLVAGFVTHFFADGGYRWLRDRFCALPPPAQGLVLAGCGLVLRELAHTKIVPFIYFQF